MRQNNTTGKSAKAVQCSKQKYSAFAVGQISGLTPRVSPDERGVRTSRTRGEMRWTRRLRKTSASCSRTAKSCGPGAAVLASSSREASFPGMTVAKEPFTGESTVSRKATAQGRPGCSRWTCMLVCVFFDPHCTRDRGCQPAPGLPCALYFWGANEVANLGRNASRERDVTFSRRHPPCAQLRTGAGDPVFQRQQ